MAKKDEKKKQIVLTVGSQYRVKSLESREHPLITHGKFLGYTPIGGDDGLCIELDDSHKDLAGRTRVIPSHMIIAIDIIKAADSGDEKKKETSNYTMYG